MAQLFLTGWFEAYPGTGSRMRLNLPPGCTDAQVVLTPQNSSDAAVLDFRSGVQVAARSVQGTAWFEWDNTSDRNIPVDYEITPLNVSAEQEALLARRKLADANARTPRGPRNA